MVGNDKFVRFRKDRRGFAGSDGPRNFGTVGQRGEVVKKFCLLAIWIFAAFSSRTTNAQIPNAKDVVSSTAYTSFDPVASGKEFQIAVVLKIRDGYHINARKTTLDYLIPTDLKVEAPAGFKAGEVTYPE